LSIVTPRFVYRHGRAFFIVMAGLDPAILARSMVADWHCIIRTLSLDQARP